MKKACLLILVLIFLFLPSSSFAQYPSPPPNACNSWKPCGEHGCPGSERTTPYSCCPNCENAVICKDDGNGCGPSKQCTYVSDCLDNPYCPPPSCPEIACINGYCVSDCTPDCSSTPAPTTPPGSGDKGYIIGRIWNDHNGNGKLVKNLLVLI